jgi:L-lactate dehydrogenase complex protein LldG
MLASGADNPTGLAFLPETHMVVLRRDQLVAGLEDAWDMLRAARGPGGSGSWPRAVNFVTGPSRSADIEQTLQMGAHGPKRLHILLIDG